MGSNGTTNYNTVEKTGGEEKHTLTIAEMPSHNHTTSGGWGAGSQDNSRFRADQNSPANSWTAVGKTGGGGSHNNMQPYITVYMWKRTA